MSWCGFDLTFILTVVNLTCKFLLGYMAETVRCRDLILARDIG